MERRTFIQQAGLATAGLGFGLHRVALGSAPGQSPFVGIQLGSHSLFDEGIEPCLDRMQQSAAVNAIFLYATIYQGYSSERKLANLAPDHGITPIDPAGRNLPLVWFRPREKYYTDTFMKHWQPTRKHEFYGRDVFEETFKPAEKRGMKVYARMLEGYKPFLIDTLTGYDKVLAVDLNGEKTHMACWNHPAYRAWWLGTVRDLFENYPLAGLKWGAERSGPLAEWLSRPPWHSTAPQCFCEHCITRGNEKNIDAGRAKEGFRKLMVIKNDIADKKMAPVDGAFISIMRVFYEYPEVLAWDRLWYESKERLARDMYSTIKSINPKAEFGRHIWHMMSFDPFYRIATNYADMAGYADWLKPVVYHEAAADRFRNWTVNSLRQGFLHELPPDMAGAFLYRVFGYDPDAMPKVSDKETGSFPADYVLRETERCVKGVNGRARVYPGIGFDIPGQQQPTNPDVLYDTVVNALKVGADGILISREYDEMRMPGLNAIGKAMRNWRG